MNVFLATIQGNRALLDEEESWHCTRVLRSRAGEMLRLIDGQGNFYEAKLELVSDKRCEAVVTGGPFPQQKRDYRFHLAIAPTKQMDRMEWMLEKAVEIGIDEVSFVICERSERTVLKTDRLKKIAVSAVKQSLQAAVPVVNEVVKFREFVKTAAAGQKLIAWCGEGEKQEVRSLQFNGKTTLALVGPEGDFTGAEVAAALSAGFLPLTLGQNRLRTETAGLTLVQAASLL